MFLDTPRKGQIPRNWLRTTLFTIGTYISNDTDVPALNIVMKTTACNGMDVAKISDTRGKGMCKNPDYVEYLQRCINWRMENDK